ncbi:MAG: CotH kinase family protein, partial [Lachnospiraceae bacterium]|nr:CotH kinase family protein [Lachnospiraceae bacterium]
DWLEITNNGEADVSLKDYYVSDDADEPLLFALPDRILKPGGQILIYADGTAAEETQESKAEKKTKQSKADKDARDSKSKASGEDGSAEGPGEIIHAPFKLSKDGERLTITHKDGTQIDVFSYAGSKKDYAILADGTLTEYATPGYPNDDFGYYEYLESLTMPEGLCITEVVNSNEGSILHDDYVTSDWIELYNHTGSTVDLSEYYVSDDMDEPMKAQLPAVTLGPEEYQVIFFDEAEEWYKTYVTGYTIGSEDQVFLFDKSGSLVDAVTVHLIPNSCSYGRLADGKYAYFQNPTPGRGNGAAGLTMIAKTPETSVAQGVYESAGALSVELSGEGQIFYTLDGSTPDITSRLYEAPIEIARTSVIRAVSVTPGKMTSRVMTASYIMNEGHVLPVLSLVTDEENFYDDEIGIYVTGNYDNYQQKWERPCSLTFFADGGTVFSEDCGVQLMGEGSRECEKKSLRINFKAGYGKSKLEADVFGNGITKHKSIAIRAGEDMPYAIIRNDAFLKLAKPTNALTQDTRWCVLYLNGSYFGLYTLSERFSSYWYEQHYGVPEENMEIEKAPVFEDDTHFKDLLAYAEENDMTDPEAYAYLSGQVDEDSLIDWIVLEAYSHNMDISGNVRYVYSLDGTVPMKYAFFDLDWAFEGSGDNFEVMTLDRQWNKIYNALMENEEFRARFIRRMGELLGGPLRKERMAQIIAEEADIIRPEVPRERSLWNLGGEKFVQDWEEEIDYLQNYLERVDVAEDMIESFRIEYGLSEEEEATLREAMANAS